MKTLLVGATLALSTIPGPSYADAVIGGSAAQSCYRSAAEYRHDIPAIDECTTALGEKQMTSGDRAGTYVNRGILYMLAGKRGSAVQDFDQAIAIDPQQAEAWLNKAVTMVNAGQGSDALGFADRALQLHTQKPALAYYVRGLAHEEEGQTGAAYADLRNAAALDPNWPEPAEQLRRYRVVPR